MMYIIGIDLGTTTISMIAADAESGNIRTSKTIQHNAFLQGHIPESRVQDAGRLSKMVQTALEELIEEYGIPSCIGLTGQMHGMLYVDTNGNAVSPLYIWQDGCGNEKMEDGRSYAEVLKEINGSVQDLCETVLLNIGTGSQVSMGTEKYYACSGSVELRPCTGNTWLLVGSGLCGGKAYAMLEQFYREAAGTEETLYGLMEQQARDFMKMQGREAAWKIKTTFVGTRDNPAERGSMTGIGLENFHPAAMTLGIMQGMLTELFELYQQMCEKTGKKAVRLVGSGNGLRKNSLMRELAEEIFGMKLEIPVCQEEAAYGAALHAGKVILADIG